MKCRTWPDLLVAHDRLKAVHDLGSRSTVRNTRKSFRSPRRSSPSRRFTPPSRIITITSPSSTPKLRKVCDPLKKSETRPAKSDPQTNGLEAQVRDWTTATLYRKAWKPYPIKPPACSPSLSPHHCPNSAPSASLKASSPCRMTSTPRCRKTFYRRLKANENPAGHRRIPLARVWRRQIIRPRFRCNPRPEQSGLLERERRFVLGNLGQT